ncbi:hypothetical protein Tco_0281740 [Tanacetum coccineum]
MSSFNLPKEIDKSMKVHLNNVIPKDLPYYGKIKLEKAKKSMLNNSSTLMDSKKLRVLWWTKRDGLQTTNANSLTVSDFNPAKIENWRDLPRDTPLVKVEVLRYDIKRSKVRSGNNVIHGMSYQWNKTNKNIRVILHSIHSDDGNPTSANIKQALSSHNVLQLKNFEKDGYTSFQDEERYDHVGLKVISLQEGKRSQDDEEIMFG